MKGIILPSCFLHYILILFELIKTHQLKQQGIFYRHFKLIIAVQSFVDNIPMPVFWIDPLALSRRGVGAGNSRPV